MPKVLTHRFNRLVYNKISVVVKRGAKDNATSKAPDKTETPPPPDMRTFKIYRFAGVKSKSKPTVMSVELDVNKMGGMVLDAMIKIKDLDPTFTFRRSCREGICGSCAVMLQGGNCLACITSIPSAKVITILPLPHMYVIRDLVVDMTHFINGYNSIRPYLIRKDMPALGQGQFAQTIHDNKKVVGLYECVLCACCSTSCPSYWWNGRKFLGPATLLHAYRWITDSRDEDAERRLNELKDDFKAFRCHTIMNCALVCPKLLNPAVPIAKLKRMLAGFDKKPEPQMHPMKLILNQQKQDPTKTCKCNK